MATLLSTTVNGTINSTGNTTAAGFTGNANVAGTGAATYHPSGIYSTGTNWLYGTMYLNGNDVYDINGIRAFYFYDRADTSYYVRPHSTSRVYHIHADHLSIGQGINTSYRVITNGDYYANGGGNFWAEGRFKQYRGSGTWHDVIDSGNIGSQSVNYAASAGAVAASGITGQTGMWTSSARPGPYRLYRNEDNSAYNVQTTWSADVSGYWSLRGYLNDSYHAPCYVGYAGYAPSAGNADTVDSLHASSFTRNDTTGQYLKPYYEYGSALTTERPVDLVNQMGGGGLRVDFMNPSYTGSGNWNHVITFSGYNGYNMYQLGANYDGGTGTDLWVRSEANHGRTSWTSWRKLLNSSNYTDYTFQKNEWNGNIYIHTDGRIYGTIFYDANDTAYYLNPNSDSNLWRFTEATLNRHSLNSRQTNSPWSTRSGQGTLYQTGAMGWGYADFNAVGSNWGSGFIDIWGSPGNRPSTASGHWVGMQAFHYNNSDSSRFHGWQMACAQEADNRWYWRSAWDTPRAWVEMIHSGNIGSQSVSYASSAGSVAWDNVSSKPGIYLHNTWHGNTYLGTGGDIYCTILYDSNNSGYYLDPNGTSRLNRTNYDYVYSYDWVYAQGDIIAYYSDERLKTKVGNIENALDKIKQLTGFYYVNNDLAKSFGYKSDKIQVGLSAQDVQRVLPEVVTVAPFDTEFDENNQAIGSKSGESYLTVNYDKLVPLLIESIKEQQDQIEELKEEIKKLKGE